MMDLNGLDQFINKYVVIDITRNGGCSAAGWVVIVKPIQTVDGLQGREIMVDYGFGFFITEQDEIKEVEPPEDDPGIFDSSTVSTFEDL